jgi:hypothetical protein
MFFDHAYTTSTCRTSGGDKEYFSRKLIPKGIPTPNCWERYLV